ncbi:structural cement protein Gp24 [Sphingobium yanoikuyae]|jgi:hypothetical protein|uniref:structural cement protein Gp24 n=1 Tax=Sphingobium yanoikuyae TaxID=13690 RepID=UPI0008473C9C|nr:hypothetical protein [Sphingobium yanoikuyae]
MAVNQDTYTDMLAPAYAGMVANGETSNRISRTCEDSAGIPFGVPVYRGAGDHGCTRTPNAFLLGITIAHEALGLLTGQTADRYQQYDNVAILPLGVIWVVAGEAVTDGAPAYDTGSAIVDTVGSNTALTDWQFDITGANADLVKLSRR